MKTPVQLFLVFTLAFVCFTSVANAQDRGDQPTRIDLSVTGGYISGNLHQAQLQGRTHLSHSTARSGIDVIGSAFRLWRPIEPEGKLEKVGDDQSLLVLPFYYVGEKPYILGVAQVERSGLRMIENRVNGGFGMGLAPIRKEHQLIRFAVGGQFERTKYAADLLAPEWAGNANPRPTPRIFTVGNGWFRPKGSPVGGFFVGAFLINPSEARDIRGRLDAGLDFRVTQTFSTRLALNAVHESVVPEGLKTTDIRSTAGFTWKTPAKK